MFSPASLLEVIQVLDVNASVFGVLSNQDIISGYQIDSRSVQNGHVFVAFHGNNQDGHDYLDQAQKNGASCALVTRFVSNCSLGQIKVNDPLAVLVHIARVTRNRWPQQRLVVAITGSVGKTSTKELCAGLLAKLGKTHKTFGNQNNVLGLSLTILNTRADALFAVLELGINAKYEMETLADICKPDVAIITNIAPCHLEKLENLAGVAREKSGLFQALGRHATAIIPTDTPHVDILQKAARTSRKCSFGQASDQAWITVKDVELDTKARPTFTMRWQDEQAVCQLQTIGAHQVNNALAAATCAIIAGMRLSDIAKALSTVDMTDNRMQLVENGQAGAWLLFDAYNASPLSLEKALQSMSQFSQQDKCLVLADMAELGDSALSWHRDAAYDAEKYGVTKLFTYGSLAIHTSNTFSGYAQHFEDLQQLQTALLASMHKDMVILIKGSRVMQLQTLSNALIQKQEEII